MNNKIITSEGNVQFQYPDGGIVNVHPSLIYTVFNEDTVSFMLIPLPKSSGLAIMTSKAKDLELNGTIYSIDDLPNAIAEAFSDAGAQARAEIVDELPTTGKTNTIYLVPKEEGEGYDEYIYLKDEQRWELIGDTSIEMKNYLKKVDFNAYSAATEIVINSISGAIDTEISNREAADTVISGAVDTLSTNLANEVSRAQNAETELSNKIDAVSGDAEDIQAELDVVSASLESEVSARTEADDAFDARLDEDEKVIGESLNDLNTRMTANEAAESVISGAVDTLSTNLANEVSRAQNAEAELSDKIDVVSGNAITSGEVQTMIDESISGKADADSVYTKSESDTLLAAKQDQLIAGENIIISGNVISSEGGGGKAVTGGTNISVTTGETADTINCTLPITAGTGTDSLILGYTSSDSYWRSQASGIGSIASGARCFASTPTSIAVGYNSTASGGGGANGNFAQGYMTTASGNRCHSEGLATSATSDASHSEGYNTVASGNYSHSEGEEVKATNVAEHSQGRYNVSNKANTTWGDSGNTLFSVGNGTADNARHNAFEIRQNGDIYITSGGTDIKLQDHLGGGGGGGMTEDDELLLATALTDLNDRKIDASEVKSNYQKKGDYATKSELGTKANASEVMTLEKATKNEQVTASALNNLNNKFGGLSLVKITESEYAALTTKDENILYIVVADPS